MTRQADTGRRVQKLFPERLGRSYERTVPEIGTNDLPDARLFG